MGNSFAGNLGSRVNGLQGYLPLDDTSGAPKDLSGNNVPWVNSGATQGVLAGDLGLAVSTDGVNDTINTTDATILAKFANGTIRSVSGWFAAGDYNANDCAFGMGENNTNDVFGIYPYFDGGMGADQIRIWFNGEYIFQQSSALLADGSLNHICVVSRSATEHELYINGFSVGTDSTNKTMTADIDYICVGAYDIETNEAFEGDSTIIKLWDVGLTSAEVLEDFKYPS